MITRTIHIGGMTCISCQNRIEKKLKSIAGVEDAAANFNTGTATVTYNDSVVNFNEIAEAIEQLDYTVLDEKRRESYTRVLGTLAIILALYMLLRQFGLRGLASAFPLAEAGMGYGMLFVIGLITSVHCVAMCGGINLSQTLTGGAAGSISAAGRTSLPVFALLRPGVLYNTGRVISYTAVGTIVGALGSVITLSGRFQGTVQLVAGVFMAVMGINMLGFFPSLKRFTPGIPKIFAKKIDEQKTAGKHPLFIGLLNGFMPCGPLQAMQLYALSTGSPVRGGVSMLLFSLGTVPLMFGLGAVSSALSGPVFGRGFAARVMKIGAILVTVLGLTMFSNGWSLGGFSSPVDILVSYIVPSSVSPAQAVEGNAFEPVIADGVQMVNSTLSAGRYPAITVRQGVPVKWTINAPQGSVNGCNNRMIIREYGIEYRFKTGENVIEFVPEQAGKFSYSCWMGMIRSSITVVAEGETVTADAPGEGLGESLSPAPAGISIPTDRLAAAEIREDGRYQAVTIRLSDEGFDPAVIVVQRGVPTVWTINNNSLDPGNSRLIFPAYYTQLDIEQGDNVIQVLPDDDFDFSTGDNVFYGYVKVVDDLETADMEAIKAEVGNFETLIYPDAYFEAAASAGGCCGNAGV
jgi:sulfite exporter TauE/SafE/copper chaperone CopZ/plastocyanin domain-containing protein